MKFLNKINLWLKQVRKVVFSWWVIQQKWAWRKFLRWWRCFVFCYGYMLYWYTYSSKHQIVHLSLCFPLLILYKNKTTHTHTNIDSLQFTMVLFRIFFWHYSGSKAVYSSIYNRVMFWWAYYKLRISQQNICNICIEV